MSGGRPIPVMAAQPAGLRASSPDVAAALLGLNNAPLSYRRASISREIAPAARALAPTVAELRRSVAQAGVGNAARAASGYVSPTASPAIRNDRMGLGGFGVPRRSDETGKPFSHRGIDLLAAPGDAIRAPIGGKVIGIGLAHPGDKRLQAVAIEGTDGLKHTIVYVSPTVKAGDTIEPGQVIGSAQDPSIRYGGGMKPHIYWRAERGSQALDPTGFISGQMAGSSGQMAGSSGQSGVIGQAGPDTVEGGGPVVDDRPPESAAPHPAPTIDDMTYQRAPQALPAPDLIAQRLLAAQRQRAYGITERPQRGEPLMQGNPVQSGGMAMPTGGAPRAPLPEQNVALPPGGVPTVGDYFSGGADPRNLPPGGVAGAAAAPAGAGAAAGPSPVAAAGPMPGAVDVQKLLGDYLKQQRMHSFFDALGRIGANIGAGKPWGYSIAEGAQGAQPEQLGLRELVALQQLQAGQEREAAGRSAIAAQGGDPNAPEWLQQQQYELTHPKPGEGFTLGNTRFDASGNPIVSVPDPSAASYGVPYRDDAGNLVQKNEQSGKVDILVKASEGTGAAPKGALVTIQRGDGTQVTYHQDDPALNAELAKPGTIAVGSSQTPFDVETKLRQEFNGLPEVKAFKEIVPIVRSAREAVTRNGRAADLNLVYAVAKVFDPMGAVREFDQVGVENASAIPDRIMSWINYVNNGGKITGTPIAAQIMTEVESRAAQWQELYGQAASRYGEMATSYKADPKKVISELALPAATPAPSPDDTQSRLGPMPGITPGDASQMSDEEINKALWLNGDITDEEYLRRMKKKAH
jgi:hypothetical protein